MKIIHLFQKLSFDRVSEPSAFINCYKFLDHLNDCKLSKNCRSLNSMAHVLVLFFTHTQQNVLCCYIRSFRCAFSSEHSNRPMFTNSEQPTQTKETRHAYKMRSVTFMENNHTGNRCMCGSIIDFYTY